MAGESASRGVAACYLNKTKGAIMVASLRHWTVMEESRCLYLDVDTIQFTNAVCAIRRVSERFRWLLGENPDVLSYRAVSDLGEFSLRLEKEPDVATGAARLKALQSQSPEFECQCGYWSDVPPELVEEVRKSLCHYMRPRWFERDGKPVFALLTGSRRDEVVAICPECSRHGVEQYSCVWTPPTDLWIANWCQRAARFAPRYRNVEYLDASGAELLIRGRRIMSPTDRAIGCEQLMEQGW